jgi:SAM-dependent methyltransferase
MEAFYALARLDYQLLAGALDWPAVLADAAARAGGAPSLLDVACGSGKFPAALLRDTDLSAVPEIRYDLLDPSAFSLTEAAAVLQSPFAERARFETTLEGLDPDAGPWDVVWATHALYALQPQHLTGAVARFLTAGAEDAFSFIAQGAADGHYLRIYEAFLDGVRSSKGTQYIASDDLIAELRRQGAEPQVRRLAYDHVIEVSDTVVLEGYLQRCLFDDSLSLHELLAAPVLGAYLASQLDEDAGVYRFHQEVDCIVLAPEGVTVPWTAAS